MTSLTHSGSDSEDHSDLTTTPVLEIPLSLILDVCSDDTGQLATSSQQIMDSVDRCTPQPAVKVLSTVEALDFIHKSLLFCTLSAQVQCITDTSMPHPISQHDPGSFTPMAKDIDGEPTTPPSTLPFTSSGIVHTTAHWK
jgi:hypothetical protein